MLASLELAARLPEPFLYDVGIFQSAKRGREVGCFGVFTRVPGIFTRVPGVFTRVFATFSPERSWGMLEFAGGVIRRGVEVERFINR